VAVQLLEGAVPADRTRFFAKHLRPSGRPWSFERHEYLRALVADDSPHVVIIKGAQVGCSTFALGCLLHWNLLGHKVGYYLSDRDFMQAFVQDRLDPLINADALLAQATLEGKDHDRGPAAPGGDRLRRKSADNLRIKHIGPGSAWFMGLQKRKDVKSLDLDAFILDEVDEVDQDLAVWLVDRILHSDFKRRLELSQPSVPDWGIAERYELSDQKSYQIRCARCRTWHCLEEEWPDCLALRGALPRGAGLPSSRGAGIPSSRGAGLPSSRGAGLPSSRGAGLPSSRGAGILPASRGAGVPPAGRTPDDFPAGHAPAPRRPGNPAGPSLAGQPLGGPDPPVRPAVADAKLICIRCGARIGPLVPGVRAEWVARHPGRPPSGYRISQVYGPAMTPADLAARYLAAQRSRSKLENFTISILGMPFPGDRQPLSEQVLANACGDWPLGLTAYLQRLAVPRDGMQPLRVAGVDVGDLLHVVRGVYWEEKLAVADAQILPDDWDKLARLLAEVDFFVIDAMPYKSSAKRLLRTEGLNGALSYLNSTALTLGFEEPEHQRPIRVVKHDRTTALDEMTDAMIAGDLRLPAPRLDVTQTIKRHCKALVKDLNLQTGKMEYKRAVENHFGMALAYLVMAKDTALTLGLGPRLPLDLATMTIGGALAPTEW